MKKQIILDCVAEIPKQKTYDAYQKQKWRNALQKYCDAEAWDDKNAGNAWCKCGYMNYCDECLGSDMTNPCVKAICEFASKNHIKIDYENFEFEKFLESLGD